MKEVNKYYCFICDKIANQESCSQHPGVGKIYIERIMANRPKEFLGKEWWEWLGFLCQTMAVVGLFIPILTHLGFGYLEKIFMIFGITWIFSENDWV